MRYRWLRDVVRWLVARSACTGLTVLVFHFHFRRGSILPSGNDRGILRPMEGWSAHLEGPQKRSTHFCAGADKDC
ncbi:uncharacterized protein P884DRAFT_24475 [Thermothelomyces heterothallicus CBS 202.75]|uniref:uncharacterized protein n=1 Tax=Thermothelomyces heterothallicus CBS 202.75 TaxID=1149848 RepID=UPI0037420439